MGWVDTVNVTLVRSLDDAYDLKRWLGERREGWVGLDTETTGLDTQRDTVRLVQVGDTSRGWAIPAEDWRGLVRELLTEYQGEWVGWNSKYDEHMLLRYCGAIPKRYHDGQILAHLAAPLERTALKEVSKRLVAPETATLSTMLDEQMSRNGWDWATVPIDLPAYWAYGALDPILTAACAEKLRAEAEAQGQVALYELELQAAHVCRDMESRGLRVDVQYAEEQCRIIRAEIGEISAWAFATYGAKLGSRSQVADLLIAEGVKLSVKTPSGAYSLAREHISDIEHPLAKAFIRKNLLQVLANNFFSNVILYQREGLLHPDIKTLAAKTGRMSVSRPSLQNQPRSKRVRDVFIPRDDHQLVAADFRQIEMRLLAHFSQEPQLINFYHQGRDLPTEIARAVFHISGSVPKPLRYQVKGALYALGYGAGPAKIAKVLGLPETEGHSFLDRLYTNYPRLRIFFDTIIDGSVAVADEGMPWVRSPRWRRRYFVPTMKKAYQLTNYLIQGEAGIVMKDRLVALHAAGLGEYMVLPVHDEVLCDVPVDTVDDVRATLDEVMADRSHYAVPLEVEVDEPLTRWGDKYEAFDAEEGEHAPDSAK